MNTTCLFERVTQKVEHDVVWMTKKNYFLINIQNNVGVLETYRIINAELEQKIMDCVKQALEDNHKLWAYLPAKSEFFSMIYAFPVFESIKNLYEAAYQTLDASGTTYDKISYHVLLEVSRELTDALFNNEIFEMYGLQLQRTKHAYRVSIRKDPDTVCMKIKKYFERYREQSPVIMWVQIAIVVTVIWQLL